jgi:hypothetical protein
MNGFTRPADAEVNAMNGLTLGVEALEERIDPWLIGFVGVVGVVGFGDCCCSTS